MEPHGPLKLTLPLVLVLMLEIVKVAGCSPETCWVKGETVKREPVLPLAVMVPVPVNPHKVMFTGPLLPLGNVSGFGLAPMLHACGVGVGVGDGMGVGVGVAVTVRC